MSSIIYYDAKGGAMRLLSILIRELHLVSRNSKHRQKVKTWTGDFGFWIVIVAVWLWEASLCKAPRYDLTVPVLELFPMSFDQRRPHSLRRRSFVSSLVEHTKIAYYQYEVTFPLYVMSPGERLAFNSFMFIFLSLLILTAVTYFPPLVLGASRQFLQLGKSVENQLLLLI